MIVEFKMLIQDELIQFKSIGKKNDNVLSFKDSNNKQNTIHVYFLEEQITIIQEGTTKMENNYILNKKIKGYYEAEHNVSAVTHCYTTKLDITHNQLHIEYDFYFDEQFASNNTLIITF